MRKEKSNLRTRSREGTNIQQTSDGVRGKEKGCCRLSAHTSAPLIAQAEELPTTASPPLSLRCCSTWGASEGKKDLICVEELKHLKNPQTANKSVNHRAIELFWLECNHPPNTNMAFKLCPIVPGPCFFFLPHGLSSRFFLFLRCGFIQS